MKFAAAVFRNKQNPIRAVRFDLITDALLSGGVPLDEIVLLPYDDPNAVMGALARLQKQFDGVFVICDPVLLPVAREAVSATTGTHFSGDFLETENCLFAVISADDEGKALISSKLVKAVDAKRGNSYHSVVIKTVYAPAAKLKKALRLANEAAGGKLSVYASEEFADGRIEVVYDNMTPKFTADEVVRILASELSGHVYAMEDVSIAERLFDVLKLHRLKLATAESFTGGGVGQAIVSVPGASRVFYEGLNTYSNASKADRLGVTEYTLRSKGAVSNETAYEMAAGLLKTGRCDVAIATTGIAGPDSDGSGTPAGKCFIAVGTKERVRVFEYLLEGGREAVTKKAINLALFLAYKEIK